MAWLVEMLKDRFSALLGTKFIATIAGLVVTALFPDIPDETRAYIIAAIIAVYTAFTAYQNTKAIASDNAKEIELAKLPKEVLTPEQQSIKAMAEYVKKYGGEILDPVLAAKVAEYLKTH